ncbi:aldo/keto reductase-like protein [Setomelanomma holmii]|uniref:Aldo/keto reductase-like protein n=1 Tax=Setomelanomma holmii TaxID=210430 RepID=A0A9P4HL21_9PLEO|nr:aldo/keto reductase-like protein [Setomelanomma holmii]
MSLPTAPLGKNGPEVTRLGFGLMGLSAFYGKPKSDNERLALLDQAYDLGERFWDSSDIYGDNEDLLGKWFKANPDKRKDIFLATKFAIVMKPGGERGMDSSSEYSKTACAKSLERLGIDQIDLYYCHRVDGVTPIEKTVEGMAQLKKEGKIKYLGLSEVSSETLRRAYAVHPITAVQVEYSPFALDIESKQIDLRKTCRELGVAVVAYSPLNRGMLAGALKSPDDFEENDFRRNAPRFSKENFPKNLKLVDEITAIAKKKGVTPSQLTLAWLLAQGQDIFPIPGTTKLERLKENLGSLDVKLTSDDEKEIRKAAEQAEVVGGRYPESFQKALYADTPALK